jgi:16S rRNA (guanine527-N7)-methyltransferase
VKQGEIAAKLGSYAELLRQRAVPLGIVARSDASRLRERHIDDSMRALPCLDDARSAADVGSGAGLPGIPLAIARPDMPFWLIEPRRSRAAFLELCVEALGLANVRVVAARAEDAAVVVDVCLARAVDDALGAWSVARRLLRPGGWVVYFAGATWSERDESVLLERGIRFTRCSSASFSWQGPLIRMAGEENQPLQESRP